MFSTEEKLRDHLDNLNCTVLCLCKICLRFSGEDFQCHHNDKSFWCAVCKEKLYYKELHLHYCFHISQVDLKKKSYSINVDETNKLNHNAKPIIIFDITTNQDIYKQNVGKKNKIDQVECNHVEKDTQTNNIQERQDDLEKNNKTNHAECQKDMQTNIQERQYDLEKNNKTNHDGCQKDLEKDNNTAKDLLNEDSVEKNVDGFDDMELCMYCDKKFPRKEIEKHEKSHKKTSKTNQLSRKEKILAVGLCQYCGVLKTEYHSLLKHEASHRNKKINHKKSRYKYKGKPTVCEICGGTFNFISLHKIVHSNVKKYECKECGKIFKRPTNLIQHKLVHVAHGKHACAICEKVFKKRFNLRVHMRIHSDKKPFECQNCHKTFTTKQWRDNHSKICINHC